MVDEKLKLEDIKKLSPEQLRALLETQLKKTKSKKLRKEIKALIKKIDDLLKQPRRTRRRTIEDIAQPIPQLIQPQAISQPDIQIQPSDSSNLQQTLASTRRERDIYNPSSSNTNPTYKTETYDLVKKYGTEGETRDQQLKELYQTQTRKKREEELYKSR